MNKPVIAPYQLFCVLFVGRVLSAMLNSPALCGYANPTGLILGTLLGGGVQLLFLVPVFLLLRRESIVPFGVVLRRAFGPLGYPAAFLYAFYGLAAAAAAVCEISGFMLIFTKEHGMIFYLLIVFGTAALVAGAGLQTIVRIAFLLFAGLLLSLAVTTAGGIDRIGVENVAPLTADPLQDVVRGAYRYLSHNAELCFLPVLAPFVKGRAWKPASLAVGASALVFSGTVFFSSAMLGDYTGQLAFPYYTALASVDFFGVKRLDVLQIYLWLAVAVIRTAFFLFAAVSAVAPLFSPRRGKAVSRLFSLTALVGLLAVGSRAESAAAAQRSVFSLWALFPLTALFPAALLALSRIGRRKKRAVQR